MEHAHDRQRRHDAQADRPDEHDGGDHVTGGGEPARLDRMLDGDVTVDAEEHDGHHARPDRYTCRGKPTRIYL